MTDAEYRDLARADLDRYLNASLALPELRFRIEALRTKIEATVKPPSQQHVQKSKQNKYLELITTLCDLDAEYEEQLTESKRICVQIEKRISQLDGLSGAILYRRYCELKEWAVICEELRGININGDKPFLYGDSTIFRRHESALLEYGKILRVNES